MREPSHRLTQHKRRGGRSLLVLWDPEEAPTLYFKGSKPGAATAGWSLFSCAIRNACWGKICPCAHHPRVRACHARADGAPGKPPDLHRTPNGGWMQVGADGSLDRRAGWTSAWRCRATTVARSRHRTPGGRRPAGAWVSPLDPSRCVRGWPLGSYSARPLDGRRARVWARCGVEPPVCCGSVGATRRFRSARGDQARAVQGAPGNLGAVRIGAGR